ncbi:hypothetical protein [Sorangium sp. So ce1182]|uniref:hypothetical protein n=1 Tax=Sorangium sp. So ce1182 TaxID=3133334 RepID=UPI003F613980
MQSDAFWKTTSERRSNCAFLDALSHVAALEAGDAGAIDPQLLPIRIVTGVGARVPEAKTNLPECSPRTSRTDNAPPGLKLKSTPLLQQVERSTSVRTSSLRRRYSAQANQSGAQREEV